MTKNLSWVSRLLVVLAVLLAFVYLWTSANPYWPYWLAQRQMAKSFGVQISDFPVAYAFPVGYYRAVLKPGMSSSEVHSLIKAYEAVFTCAARNGEVYYYFTRDDSRALRFEIQYDQNLKFQSMGTEDEDSRTISVQGCAPGFLGSFP